MRPSQIRLFGMSAMIAAPLAAVLGVAPASAHEQPTTTPAARFLQGIIETAFNLVRPPVTAKANRNLDALIGDSMDWPSLTQFAIGHYRATLDATGMGGVTSRLEEQLGALARRAGVELPNMTLAVHDMRIDRDGNRHVLSTATLPRFGEIEVEWTLAPAADGGYRISDIAAFGLTLKQFLRGWIASLIAAQGGDAAATFEPPRGHAVQPSSPQ
jgi:ABC-type transporter MlaC component